MKATRTLAVLLAWTGLCAAEPPAPVPAARAAVESVLADMRAAILAGDREAFLSHVDLSSPRFATEMRHWADDLAKYHPFEFSATIVEAGAAFDESHAVCSVRLDWRIALDSNGAALAPDKAWVRHATFPPVEFTRTPEGRWLWAGERWSVIEGDGFVVKYLPGDEKVAETIRTIFPVSRAHVDKGFDIPGTTPQEIKIYADMDHLKATVYLSMPDPVLGGWNEPGESIKFMRDYTHGEKSWTRAFAHEYGHVATWEMGPKARDLAWWMAEGVAELAAEEFDRGQAEQNNQQMRRWASSRGVIPWEKISDYQTTEQPLKHMAYVQGHHFMGYVSDRFGREKRNAWLRAMASGAPTDQACRDVLGVPFDQLTDTWRATLPAPAQPRDRAPAGS